MRIQALVPVFVLIHHFPSLISGSYENETFRERTYYRITLIVYEEQEHAIIDLFKDRQWIYMKLGMTSQGLPKICPFKKMFPIFAVMKKIHIA